MMLANDLDDGPVREHFRDKQPVLVRIKRGAQAPLYVPGIILERRPKAAKVKTADWINYMFYSDLQPDPSREKPSKPLATIADIMPRLPPPEAEGIRAPAVLMTAEQVQKSTKWAEEIKEEMAKKKRVYQSKQTGYFNKETKPPIATELGGMIRARRHQAELGQGELAQILKIGDQATLSRVELGKQIPGDEILIKLNAQFPDLDLGELQKARDRDAHRYPRQAKKLGISTITGKPAKPSTALAVSRPVVTVNGTEADPFEFVAALCQICPMPADPHKRQAWLRLARQLREVSG